MDAWVLLFGFAVSVVAGLLFGIVPAVRASYGRCQGPYDRRGARGGPPAANGSSPAAASWWSRSRWP